MHVLFLADGPLGNPILLSQGIPQMLVNEEQGIRFSVISFENPTALAQPEAKRRDTEMRRMLAGKISTRSINTPFHRSTLMQKSSLLRALRFLLMVIKGCFLVPAFVIKNKVTIIHCRSHYPTFIGCIVKFTTRAKLLYDNRGLFSQEIAPNQESIQRKILEFAESFFARYADAVVVVSKPFREHILRRIPIKKPGKITVINNCFSSERIGYSLQKREAMREQFGFSDKVVMVYSGTLTRFYLVDEILRFFKEFSEAEPNALLQIVTWQPEVAERAIKAAGISNDLVRIVTAYGNEIGDYLIAGDFGVSFYSQISDGTSVLPIPLAAVASPIKFGEYLGSGLPVVITAGIGDTQEIIESERVGVIIDRIPESYNYSILSILSLLAEQDIHERCAAAAEKYLSLQNAASLYHSVYKSLTDGK